MNRFRTLTITTVLTGLLAVGSVYAQGPDGPGRRGPGGRGGPGFGGPGLPIRALNLSDAQQEQVKTLAQQFRTQNKATADKLRAAMDAQRKAVETMPVNEQLIRSTTADLSEAQTEMALAQARMHAEMFALLTPEQQAQAKKLQAERATRDQQRQSQRQQRRQR